MFDVDDIVFARFEGYPLWPARVIEPQPQHLAHLRMKKIPSTHRLVLFYNDNGQFAPIRTSDLRSFGDHRIQNKTSQYSGPHKSQLLVAFQAALKEYPPVHSHSNTFSPPTCSPRRNQSPEKNPSSDPTSPVTGQSDSRQSTTPKINKLAKQLTPRPSSPPNTLPSHTMASRTHADTSPSTHPTQLPHHSTHSHPSDTRPPPRNSKPSPPVRLRLRLKRTSPPTSPPSPLLQQAPNQPVPKTRRLVKSETHHARPNFRSRPLIEKDITAKSCPQGHKGAAEKETSNSNYLARISADQERIPRLADKKAAHSTEEPRQRISDNASVLPQSQPVHEADRVRRIRKRKRSAKHSTSQPYDNDAHRDLQKKEMRSTSKNSPGAERALRRHPEQHSGTGAAEVKGHSAAKAVDKRTSPNFERRRKATKMLKQEMDLTDRSTAFDHLTKKECIELIEHLQNTVRCNNVELWHRGIKLVEEHDIAKTEDDLQEACSGALQKAEELLEQIKSNQMEKHSLAAQEVEAYNACKALRDVYFDFVNVNLQSMGRRIVNMVKTMRSHSIMMSMVLLDVVVLWADLAADVEVGKSAKQENANRATTKEVIAKEEIVKRESTIQESVKEEDAAEECAKDENAQDENAQDENAQDENAQDESTIDEKAKEETTQEEEMTQTLEEESKGAIKESAKKELAKKGSADKKNSARERRLDRFDRKTCLGAIEAVFKEDGEKLRMDEKGRWVIARRLEREIRPRLEEDRLGYYKACVNVIRGLRKALRHVVSKAEEQEEEEEKGTKNVTKSLLLDAVMLNTTREKTKELVCQLNGRLTVR